MSILTRLFVLATLALSAANAQGSSAAASVIPSASGFQFKEKYPEPGSVPSPKPEWMSLIANANITDAPIVKSSGSNGPQQSGNSDPYCDWTFTGCTRPTDIVTCPAGQWGITYDDGPTEFSPALYDFLDQRNQKATFFMIGGQVVRFPEYAKRAFNAGHELAMHTWSHSYLTTQTNEQIVAELKWTELAIKEITGYSPRFFRPPYGDIDDRVRSIAAALGFTPVIWDHDTLDWMAGENANFNERWIDGNVTEWASQNATGGGISLEHDLYKQTVDAAIRVLPVLENAYKVTTVGSCTGQQAYKESNNNATTTAAPSSTGVTAAASGSSAPSQSASASDEPNAGSHLALGAAGTLWVAAALSYLLA